MACPKTLPTPPATGAPAGWSPVPRPAQEVARTGSRHAQPRAWLRAVTWLVGAGLHPRSGSTTLAVAADLAARMDYTAGTVLYDMHGTARRLDVSVATVKRHVAYLRQLGALVWVRHGSRTNLHLPGRKYTATATIYAAAIPPVFDRALGHRVAGTGYAARVVGVTDAGRERAVQAAQERAEQRSADQRAARARRSRNGATERPNPPAQPGGQLGDGTTGTAPARPANTPRNFNQPGPAARCDEGRAPHSPGSSGGYEKAEVSGWFNYTSRERATCPTPTTSTTNTNTNAGRSGQATAASSSTRRRTNRPTGPRRHPMQVARDIRIAAQVRPRVGWTQREGLRRLAYALRPLIDDGMEAADIAAELTSWWLDWRPARPAAYIAAELRRRAQRDAEQATAIAPGDNAAWREYREQQHARQALEQLIASGRARTDDDRRQARTAAVYDPQQVIDHLEEHGEDDTLDLYGAGLVATAVRLAASTAVRLGR